MEKNDKGIFTVMGDSLDIGYSFYGENAPFSVTIKNKMVRPLYVNWRQSWLQIGDTPENSSNLGQYMESWEGISHIGPGDEKKQLILELSGLHFDKIDDKDFKRKDIILNNGTTEKLRSKDYTEEDSPLYLRSILFVHPGMPDEDPLIFEQDFYLANLTKANNMKPEKLAAYANRHGDSFYTIKENGKGLRKALKITGEVILITGAIAIAVITEGEVETGEEY